MSLQCLWIEMARAPRDPKRPRSRLGALALLLLVAAASASGCRTSGNAWMSQPYTAHGRDKTFGEPPTPPTSSARTIRPQHYALAGTVIGDDPTTARPPETEHPGQRKIPGKLLGKFRNTYYDLPSEKDYSGSTVQLQDADCKPIRLVPRHFFEALCVQGSGTLADGATVSFARRDCDCADVCPRTGQRICYDRLDRKEFPWGRGATGQAITPLLTVAVDSNVVPLGTALYIPEYDGLPRDVDRSALHDGCFIAQDRGLKVQGKQVDVFTGHESVTKLWNRLVPSNQGVRVVVEHPKCARATP